MKNPVTEFAQYGQYARQTVIFDSLTDLVECGARKANSSYDEAAYLARYGWSKAYDETMRLAEQAVTKCEQMHPEMRVSYPVYDIAGGAVDIGRYVADMPDCMVRYPIQEVSRLGKVITLVAPVTYFGGLDGTMIYRRGQVVTAFALALSRLGHSIEIWADRTNTNSRTRGNTQNRIRCLIKGASDPLIANKILFAFANEGMLRGLCWSADDVLFTREPHSSTRRTTPTHPPADGLPDGAIVLPPMAEAIDEPNPEVALTALLKQAGFIAD